MLLRARTRHVFGWARVLIPVRHSACRGRMGLPVSRKISPSISRYWRLVLIVIKTDGLILLQTIWQTPHNGHPLARLEDIASQATLLRRLTKLARCFTGRRPNRKSQ